MTPTELWLLAINTIGCTLACWYSLTGLNACTRKTALSARISFAAIAIGAFAALLHPPELDIGGVGSILIAAGIGIGFFANRRKCVCLNCPMRPGPRRPEPIEWGELPPTAGHHAAAHDDHRSLPA